MPGHTDPRTAVADVCNRWHEALEELRAIAADAPAEAIPQLAADVAVVWVLLLGRPHSNGEPPQSAGADELELMTPDHVAQVLSVDRRWVYRHAKELGGVSLSEKCLRFPRSRIERYLARKRL